jgi:xanthine permease XanP
MSGAAITRFLRRAYAEPILQHDAKKPPNLIYNADDKPNIAIAVSNGIQHVGLIAINLVYPLLVCRAVSAPVTVVEDMLSVGMMVLAVGTILQVLRFGPIGSGYMLPATFTATYFAPSLLAAHLGGLPLVFGMTVFAGVLETVVAPLLNRLRTFLPVEISGLVIFMIGVAAGLAGLRTLLGPAAAPVTSPEWIVAGVTLAGMAALNVWGRGIARMLCALIGLVVGHLAAIAAGLLTAEKFAPVADARWFGFPHLEHIAWSFDATLVAPFAIASVAAAMKAAGTLTICQKMNDANWLRPDMRSVTRGVLTDGLTTTLAGLFGTVGTNTSTPSAGLAAATGIASRNVAVATAAVFFLLGFCPKLTAVLAIMPRAVVVAALIFTVTFIMVNGLQVMMSRMLDVRRTLVLGLAIMGGMTIEVFPTTLTLLPHSIATIAGSSLVSATAIALILNLVFRIGVRRTATLRIAREQVDIQKVEEFFVRQSGAWGARPDVARRATFGVVQLVDAIAETCWDSGTMSVRAGFDEFNLDITVTYPGQRIDFPEERPTVEQIHESEDGARLLAGFMLRRNADRIQSADKDGECTVHFHFEH